MTVTTSPKSTATEHVINLGHVLALFATLASPFMYAGWREDRLQLATDKSNRAPYELSMELQEQSIAQVEDSHDIAIGRVESGACVLVVDSETSKPILFSEATKVGSRYAPDSPLRRGTFICNHFGETAIAAGDGSLENIATVPLDYRTKFTTIMNIAPQWSEE